MMRVHEWVRGGENRSRFSSFRFNFTSCDRSEDGGRRTLFDWIAADDIWLATVIYFNLNSLSSRKTLFTFSRKGSLPTNVCDVCVWFIICHLSFHDTSRRLPFSSLFRRVEPTAARKSCDDRRHPTVQLAHDKNVSTNLIRETRSLYVLRRSLDISATIYGSLEKAKLNLCVKSCARESRYQPEPKSVVTMTKFASSRRRTQFT